MKKSLFFSIICISIFFGCSDEQINSNIAADISGTYTTKVGDSFIINLESNPTTGYSWRTAEFEHGIVELVNNEYKPQNNTGNIVGSGGIEVWTFKAVKKGKITIIFEYVRPWEKDIPPIKQETYLITVK
jgi:inhibitor of cysteine peptidase